MYRRRQGYSLLYSSSKSLQLLHGRFLKSNFVKYKIREAYSAIGKTLRLLIRYLNLLRSSYCLRKSAFVLYCSSAYSWGFFYTIENSQRLRWLYGRPRPFYAVRKTADDFYCSMGDPCRFFTLYISQSGSVDCRDDLGGLLMLYKKTQKVHRSFLSCAETFKILFPLYRRSERL